MRNKLNNPAGQLRWVILLLSAAVILPTVCLLWFMNQAIKNERLAVRQKLEDTYQRQLNETVRKIETAVTDYIKKFDEQAKGQSIYEVFDTLADENGCDGLILFDANDRQIYPTFFAETDIGGEKLSRAWQLEFEKRDYEGAVKAYDEIIETGDDTARLKTITGKARCLEKQGKVNEAIAVCKEAALADSENITDANQITAISNIRLLLLDFLVKKPGDTTLFEETVKKLISTVYKTNSEGITLPTDYNLFLADKLLEMWKLNPKIAIDKDRIRRLTEVENFSIEACQNFGDFNFAGLADNSIKRLTMQGKDMCCFAHKAEGRTFVLLWANALKDKVIDYLHNVDAFEKPSVNYRILDDKGKVWVGGEKPEVKPFAKASVEKYFPGWEVELYLADADIFDSTAEKQTAIYLWAGALVIFLILAAGGISVQVVGRQIKLNRLKNDFIATVTHELKTPLSSMRVLVDTLLEGNYSDQKQATEYLQLISKENARLSRLIDNFLTFSRMERNKRAFEMASVSPIEIANMAAETVSTKFEKGGARLKIDVSKPLPMINADKDAMVTVLVNLLDNAYKYSNDDKQIELKVFGENGMVCFAVKDNGVGIGRRHIRRIFDRFYQVDSSLSRRVEGAGLGLAIVKFIVDAHKGQITVDSKPGEGSEFIVRLPVVK